MLSSDFLAGFLEAEGSFGIIPNNARTPTPSWTCVMSLAVREDDAELLRRCRRWLGIGTITRRGARGTSQPQACWVVRRKADTARLADVLGGRFRGRNARVLAHWLEAVDIWTGRSYGTTREIHRELGGLAIAIKQLRAYKGTRGERPIFPLSSDYLGGLITGEGSFMLVNKRRARFSIHMRADETPLLSAIAAETSLGEIRQHPPYGRSAQSVSWQVHRMNEMAELVRWLDLLELAGRKLEQFRAWRPAAVRMADAAAKRSLGLKFPQQA